MRRIGEAVLRCPLCHAHFDVVHAGAGVDEADPTVHLDPIPLLVRDGVLSIAVAAEQTGAGVSMTGAYDVLARIRANRSAPQPAGERCEMCSEQIGDEHSHVVNVEGRQLMCVCRGCYLLFTDSTAALRFRAVPDRYLSFPEFALGRREWQLLQIPVGLAFFFRNSALDRTVAFYPGPAGATESELDLSAWNGIRAADPRVDMLADDTEALIVRVPEDEDQPPECYLVPIDACYEFVGRLRMLWHGFDGGQHVRAFIDEFFEHVAARGKAVARMTEVTFAVLDVSPEPYAVTPVLTARIGIAADGDEPVHAIALRCQVRIEPLRRAYSDEEAAGLLDMFGPRERWATTQHNFLFLHSSAMVQGFYRGHTGGPAAGVHLRLRGHRRQVLPCSSRRRDPPAIPVQRHGLPQGPDQLRGATGAVGP